MILSSILFLNLLTIAYTTDTIGNHSINVADPDLGTTQRRFLITNVPSSNTSKNSPIVLGFHGQSNSPESWGPRPSFTALAKQYEWLMVYPAGIWDKRMSDGSLDSTWNCGTQDDNSVCVDNTAGTQCLESCHSLGRCKGKCNWATCHNDLDFIDQMLNILDPNQTRQIFLVGESNGGMFIHYLIQSFPGRFLAAAPTFGSPLLGYLVGNKYQLLASKELASKTSILQLHDRSDIVIPWQGGSSQAGWLYESMNRSMGVWSVIHGCDGSEPVENHNPFVGGSTNVRCYNYEGCPTDKYVGFCMYDGEHGDWPDQPRGADIVASFFLNVSKRTKTIEIYT